MSLREKIRMRQTTRFVAAALVLAFAGLAGAQQPSPSATADVTLKGQTISIQYSRPSMRGRKIMGELVPYGQVWRTGANEATTLTTESNLMLGTLHVPPGTYTLYTIPGE